MDRFAFRPTLPMCEKNHKSGKTVQLNMELIYPQMYINGSENWDCGLLYSKMDIISAAGHLGEVPIHVAHLRHRMRGNLQSWSAWNRFRSAIAEWWAETMEVWSEILPSPCILQFVVFHLKVLRKVFQKGHFAVKRLSLTWPGCWLHVFLKNQGKLVETSNWRLRAENCK